MKKPTLHQLWKLNLSVFLLLASTYASAALYYVEVTDPESIIANGGGTYNPRDGSSLDRLYAAYDSYSDTFSFRYDFTASPTIALGDAYFKFTNDGELPDGNRGTAGIPRYKIDSQTKTLKIESDLASYVTGIDYAFDDTTRQGYIAFEHSVSEVWNVFAPYLDPTVDNWSGGSFTTNFGIWSHVVDVDYYNVDPQTGEFTRTEPLLTAGWIAFDPSPGPDVLDVQTVPEPSSIFLVFLGLCFFLRRQIADFFKHLLPFKRVAQAA